MLLFVVYSGKITTPASHDDTEQPAQYVESALQGGGIVASL